jgi:hypothetical protein
VVPIGDGTAGSIVVRLGEGRVRVATDR